MKKAPSATKTATSTKNVVAKQTISKKTESKKAVSKKITPKKKNASPAARVGDIEWFEQRASTWVEAAAQIGITPALAGDMVTETTQARSAYNAVLGARDAATLATQNQTAQVKEMRTLGGQLIKAIRSFAVTQPDPNVVYQLSGVPPQAEPTPQPPEVPYDVSSDLTSEGEIALKWKGNSHGGSTVYAISRAVQVNPSQSLGPMEQIGLTGSRTFVDATAPSCTIAAQYLIKAYKETCQPRTSENLTVRFAPTGGDFGRTQFRYVA